MVIDVIGRGWPGSVTALDELVATQRRFVARHGARLRRTGLISRLPRCSEDLVDGRSGAFLVVGPEMGVVSKVW